MFPKPAAPGIGVKVDDDDREVSGDNNGAKKKDFSVELVEIV
jgi:hypothetical protein